MNETELLNRVPLGADAVFPKSEIDARQENLRKMLKEKDIDLYLTSGAENIFYLSGQQTPGYYVFQCLAIPADGESFLVTRKLEAYNARYNSYLERIYSYDDSQSSAEALSAAIDAEGWKGNRIAIDRNAWFLTVNIFESVRESLGELLDGSGLVEGLRRVKSSRELTAIERAGE